MVVRIHIRVDKRDESEAGGRYKREGKLEVEVKME